MDTPKTSYPQNIIPPEHHTPKQSNLQMHQYPPTPSFDLEFPYIRRVYTRNEALHPERRDPSHIAYEKWEIAVWASALDPVMEQDLSWAIVSTKENVPTPGERIIVNTLFSWVLSQNSCDIYLRHQDQTAFSLDRFIARTYPRSSEVSFVAALPSPLDTHTVFMWPPDHVMQVLDEYEEAINRFSPVPE